MISSTTIDLLPNEILELIFFELNLKDLGNCSCTCQKWEKIIEGQFTDKGQFIIAVGLPYQRGQKSEIVNLLNPVAKYELLPDIFPPRYGAIGGLIQNQTIIAGGFDYPNYLQDYFVDIRSQPDLKPLEMIKKRCKASSVVLNDDSTIWIVGGTSDIFESDKSHDSTEFLSINKPMSQIGPNLPFSIHSHGMVYMDADHIFIIGGIVNGKNTTNKSWIVKPKQNFKVIDGPSLNMGRSRHCCGKMKINGKWYIVVAGGESALNSTELASVELLEFDSNNGWFSGPKLPMQLADSTMITSPNGKGVVLIGGIGKLSTWYPYLGIGGKIMSPNISNSIFELTGDSIESLEWICLEQKLKYSRYGHVTIGVPDEITQTYLKPRGTSSSEEIWKKYFSMKKFNSMFGSLTRIRPNTKESEPVLRAKIQPLF